MEARNLLLDRETPRTLRREDSMTAASTITSSHTVRLPLSRPLSLASASASGSGALPSAALASGSGPASSTLSSLSSVPVSWSPASQPQPALESVRTVVPRAQLERSGRGDLVRDDDASGARLIIPANSLRSALSKPTRTGRVSCLMEVPSFAMPPGLDASPESAPISRSQSVEAPESKPFEPTPISSSPAPLSMTIPARAHARLLPAESTVPMRRPWRMGKATAAACGVGGMLVILGLVVSTTDAAASLAARIQLAFESEAIPAAAATAVPATDFAANAAPELVPVDALAPPPSAEVVQLEAKPTTDRAAVAPRPVRTIGRATTRLPASRGATAPPIRLRSPY